MSASILVFIATYNERDNLEAIYKRIKALGLGNDYLFLDDNSPDGTGKIADDLARSDDTIHVIHRSGKLGVGSAHWEGICWAYMRHYQTLITMDCDFTHQPEDIPLFIESSLTSDVVVGTRFVDPDSLKDWSVFRKFVTHSAHFLTQRLLKIPYDVSGAFRLYHLDRIPPKVFSLVTAKGYDFFFQSLFILCINGFSIHEIPIVLPARTCGHSKMTATDAVKGLSRLLATYFDYKFHRENYILPC